MGIVSYWFNRGQATVGRYLRSILDGLGHETHVLARPTKDDFYRPGHVDRDDVWSQPRVTAASQFQVPTDEYLAWADAAGLDVALLDQNYQFDAIAALRDRGVRTIGRFVWESFAASHVEPAKRALDTVYSVTACEQQRYAEMGIRSPLVRWGCHPELLAHTPAPRRERPTLLYPAGYLSMRKPTAAVLEAFARAAVPDAELIVKSQRPVRGYDLLMPGSSDELRANRRDASLKEEIDPNAVADLPGVTVITDDLSVQDYYDLLTSCHVILAPSRWEGLGLHLFEATAFGVPSICNDMPPLNEFILDGRNGLLTRCRRIGERPNGLPAMEPDVDDLARAIRESLDPDTNARLVRETGRRRDELSWDHTIADVGALVAAVVPA